MKEKLFKDKELEKKFWKTVDKINEETFRLVGLKTRKKKKWKSKYFILAYI